MMPHPRSTLARFAHDQLAVAVATVPYQPQTALADLLPEENTMDKPDDLLTTAEVALITRAPVSTVRYWRHLGAGPKSFRLGRRVLYRRAEVTRWLLDQEAADTGRVAS